ncbi:MAG TPA: prepilin-type N-terminal cleavage/methylation domain-containing protein [Enhygromyxa sp.]|nr:prepilin-type N-terminal cleavage/methylation domain-containing protein [Enhygromyxa sp.]
MPTTPAQGSAPNSAGFTLLEVLIAVAILAVSLSSLMGSQLNSMAATRYARDITAAALLAEYQIVELEFLHRREGWVSSDTDYQGDFSDQGYPDMKWECTVHFIELPEYNQLIEAKEGADEAEGKDGDNIMDAGDQAFGALGMVWPIVKAAIENSIRKVDCTVSWKNGTIDEEFAIQTFWTDPNALQQLPGAGGEFTDQDDDSGAAEGEEEGGGSSGPAGGGGRGGRGRPAIGGPGMEGGMNMGGG